MAVKRLIPRALEKVSIPTEVETFTAAYYFNSMKYRIWVGPSAPPTEYTLIGDIHRNDSVNPHVWTMYMPNGTWVSMLAGSTYNGQPQSGLIAPIPGAAVNAGTTSNVPNSAIFRGQYGQFTSGNITINNAYEAESTKWASVFTNSATTKKNIIYFTADTLSSDPGFIVHESSGNAGDGDKGVIHIIPSDNNSGEDHVAIGRNLAATNYAANTRLYVDGRIVAVSVQTTSSIEAKDNVYPTTISALDVINSVDIVDFTYKEGYGNDDPKIGFIAEDTNPILSGPDQDTMDHQNVLGTLMKAVQELSSEVTALKMRLGE